LIAGNIRAKVYRLFARIAVPHPAVTLTVPLINKWVVCLLRVERWGQGSIDKDDR
jgi:hypothetical protein